jgi:hypothetical protein
MIERLSTSATQKAFSSIDTPSCISLGPYYLAYPQKEYIVERVDPLVPEIVVVSNYESVVFNVKQNGNFDSLTVKGPVRYIKFVNFFPMISNIKLPEVEEIEIIGIVNKSLFDLIKTLRDVRISIYFSDYYNLDYIQEPIVRILDSGVFFDLTSFNAKKLRVRIENDEKLMECRINLPEHLESFRLESFRRPGDTHFLPILTIPKSLTNLEIESSGFVRIENIDALESVKELYLQGAYSISKHLIDEIANAKKLNLERLHVRTVISDGLFASLCPLTCKAQDVMLEFLHLDDKIEFTKPELSLHTYTLTMSSKLRNLYIKSMYANVVILAKSCPVSANVKCDGILEGPERLGCMYGIEDILCKPQRVNREMRN